MHIIIWTLAAAIGGVSLYTDGPTAPGLMFVVAACALALGGEYVRTRP